MPEILIVDDEKVIRETLKDILEYEKYKIEEAADGLQAIEKIKKK
ncbi:MAG: response regulator, partial [Bacteroidetes bacterium]|nr:response regulator [Bacteroidota bacterium]